MGDSFLQRNEKGGNKMKNIGVEFDTFKLYLPSCSMPIFQIPFSKKASMV